MRRTRQRDLASELACRVFAHFPFTADQTREDSRLSKSRISRFINPMTVFVAIVLWTLIDASARLVRETQVPPERSSSGPNEATTMSHGAHGVRS